MKNSANQRPIVLDLAVSLDGFIEGKNGEIDWCNMEPEMEFNKFLDQIDTIFYGRKSYELWGQFATESTAEEDRDIWESIHSKKKYVFSRTCEADDNDVIFINDNISEEVTNLKSQPGKDIWLYGGASLITSFINLGLVDEYRLSVHPVILGDGKPLFIDINERMNLELITARTFPSGVVQLIYHWKSRQ